MRGFVGIGIYHGKNSTNMGTLWRSAHNFGADFIFTIGRRYSGQCSDTTKASKHVPLFEYESFDDFRSHLPRGSHVVFIEQHPTAKELYDFEHPEQVVYVLGAEDAGIPEEFMKGREIVQIDSERCLNVAVAGSIIPYDRKLKGRL